MSNAQAGRDKPDLSIIIVNWNVAALLADCIASLPDAAGEWWPRSEVIVVDNASTDNSVAMLRERFPWVRVLALSENRGFTGGNNAGIKAARGAFLLLLNPDTVALPASIATLAGFMQAHPLTGISGPRLLNPDGTLQPSRRRFPSLLTALIESTPLQGRFPNSRVLQRFYMLDKPEDKAQAVGWLSGAALMCRRETLLQAGLFDPGYFMFSEEVDLCRRVRNAGWLVAYVPQAEIVHYGGQSTGQDVAARHIRFHSARARYFRIHEGRAAGELVRVYTLAVYAAQMLSEAAKWAVGHKRGLRAERLRLYSHVISSGLRAKSGSPPRKADALFITGEYPPAQGGVGDYTCRLRLALMARGVRVEVLAQQPGTDTSPAHPGTASTPGDATDVPLRTRKISIGATARGIQGTRARLAHIQYQTGAYGMRPTVNLLPLLLRALRGSRTPTVVTFHDLRVPYLFPKAGPLREWANRIMALGAAAVVATNPEDAETLRAWGVKRVRLIPIGSNIRNNPPPGFSREEWREARGITPDATLVAYFGFLNSTKGLDDLLRALSSIKDDGDYRLLMVGGGQGSSDPTNRRTAREVSALAGELGIEDRTIWTGYLSPGEVSAALLSADMAVLPFSDGASFRRGSLLAVLEHGLPLITTWPGTRPHNTGIETERPGDGRNLPRLVDGQNALLVGVGDPGGIARCIIRLANDSSLRARLSEGALALSRHFSWEQIARLHSVLYREVLEGE